MSPGVEVAPVRGESEGPFKIGVVGKACLYIKEI